MAREHRKEAMKRKPRGANSGKSSGDATGDGDAVSGLAGDVVVENEDELPAKALLHRCSIAGLGWVSVATLQLTCA